MPTIKLGRKGGMYPEPASSGNSEMHYPSLYIDGEKELDLPDEGTMTIRFKKTNESASKSRDGKENYSCGLDVLEISNVKGSKPDNEDESESGEDALDRLKKEAEAGEESDGEPEED